MNIKELKAEIDKKRRTGVVPDPAILADIMDTAIEMGEKVLKYNDTIKEYSAIIAENKAIFASINMYFPVLYREIKREFNKIKTDGTPG